MTNAQPPNDQRPERSPTAGYVPAFEGADGNEDPAPEAVVHSTPPAPIGPEDEDGRFQVAEEIAFDQQTYAARRVGQLPLDFSGTDGLAAPADPVDAVAGTLRADASVDNAAQRNPGDQAAAGTPQSGEAVCPECNGSGKSSGKSSGKNSGKNSAGIACPNCGGSGSVIQIVGDA